MLRRCAACGRLFTAMHSGEKFCSAACRQEKKVRELRHPCIESETGRRKRHKSTLAKESAEARKHGVTYGQWKAKKYMQEFSALERYKKNEKGTE